MRIPGPLIAVAAAALLVAGCAGAGGYGLSVANGLTVPVTVSVNGAVVGTVPAGATEDPVPGALPGRPWAVEARSPSGRLLAAMTVSAQDDVSAASGKFARADLACGRLDLWSGGSQPMGPPPALDPSRPCD